MGMFLMSRAMLEHEIETGNEYCRSFAKKELELLNKLDIAFCDMTGKPEDVGRRLGGCEVIIMPKGTYDNLQEAAIFRRTVKNLLQENGG